MRRRRDKNSWLRRLIVALKTVDDVPISSRVAQQRLSDASCPPAAAANWQCSHSLAKRYDATAGHLQIFFLTALDTSNVVNTTVA